MTGIVGGPGQALFDRQAGVGDEAVDPEVHDANFQRIPARLQCAGNITCAGFFPDNAGVEAVQLEMARSTRARPDQLNLNCGFLVETNVCRAAPAHLSQNY